MMYIKLVTHFWFLFSFVIGDGNEVNALIVANL